MKSAYHLWDHFFSPISPIRSSSDPRISGYDPSQVTGWTLFTADALGPTRVIQGITMGQKSTTIDHRLDYGWATWLRAIPSGYDQHSHGKSPCY